MELFPLIPNERINQVKQLLEIPELNQMVQFIEKIRLKCYLPNIIENRYPSPEECQDYFLKEYVPLKINIQQLQQLENVKLKVYRNAIYFGQLDNSNRHGTGISIKENMLIYEGQFINDKKHGMGVETLKNGQIYHGQYYDGVPNGEGALYSTDSYIGSWQIGKKHGVGWWSGHKGDYYLGEWENNKSNGFGIHIAYDIYCGNISNNLKHGEGRDVFANGDTFNGEYRNGKPNGFGEYKWSNGSIYKGEFQNGLRNGMGVWTNGTHKYQGHYHNDKKNGHGVFHYSNGIKYSGNFTADKRHGYGEMVWPDTAYYKGHWKEGLMDGEGIYGYGDQLLRGQWMANQLLSYERVRVALSNFPHTHVIKDQDDQDELSQVAEEPDLEQIGGQFKAELLNNSKHESDDSSQKPVVLPQIKRQFDLLSLIEKSLEVDQNLKLYAQRKTETTQTQTQKIHSRLPNLRTPQKQLSQATSVETGRNISHRAGHQTRSPGQDFRNRIKSYTSQHQSVRTSPPKKKNKKKTPLLSKKEQNVWNLKVMKLKLDPKKYGKIWNHDIVTEIKQMLYPPVWRPPNYFVQL